MQPIRPCLMLPPSDWRWPLPSLPRRPRPPAADGRAGARGSGGRCSRRGCAGGGPCGRSRGAGGRRAPPQPEVMEIVKDTFGDWQVRCAPDGNDCFMYQLAVDQAKNPVAEVSILKLPEQSEADAGATVVTPLGTLLTTGVVMQVDGGEQRQYPFAWCSQVGCFSRFGLAKPTVDQLKRGKGGSITLISVGRPEEPVVLDLSLSGFTAAFDSLVAPVVPEGAVISEPAPAAPAPAAPATRPAAQPLPSLEPRR